MNSILTIHTAGTSRLVTAAQLRAIIPALADDAAANVLIDQASGLIASETRRVLQRQEVTETLRDVCTSRLMLTRWPFATIISVVVDGVSLDAAEYEADSVSLYRLSDDRRTAWHGSKIAVRYTGGYDPIPADLQRACLDLCVNLNATTGRDMSLRSVNIPDVEAISYRDEGNGGGVIPDHVRGVIALYRDYVL